MPTPPIPHAIPATAAFAPMVEACAAHGIARTTAFGLARDELLDTFLIGRRRYVMLQSLRDLPQRLAERKDESTDGR